MKLGKACPFLCALLLAGAFQAGAQAPPPTITSVQGLAPGTPVGITYGTNLANFTLVLNGTFHPGFFQSVTWTNTITTQTFFTSVNTVDTATQIEVTIPQNLYANFTAAPTFAQPVTITLAEAGGSAVGAFTVNPPLAAPFNSILTPGTLGVAYSQPAVQFGTPPYTSTVQSGAIPAGLSLPSNNVDMTGTPTTLGVSTWTTLITDAWGNNITLTEATEIVGTPTMASMVPNSAPAGSPAVGITVTGTNFVQTANTQLGAISSSLAGIAGDGFFSFPTTVNSATQLQATVPQNDFLTPGAFIVSVEQPNFVLSNPGLAFSVLAPTITSISPSATITARPTAFTITVNGANFVANPALTPTASSVLVNSALAPTSNFVNSTTVTESQIFTPGSYQIQVENPGNPSFGSATSTAVTLIVLPAPTITSIAPTSATAGTSPALVVTGTNFTNTMQVQFNGTSLATTFVSATQLNATVPVGLMGTAGTFGVTVITADGYVTPAANFTVVASPTITLLAPSSATAGTGPIVLAVTGTNFTNTMQVQFAGTGMTTTFVSATRLNATIPAASLATAGNKAVTVATTDGFVTPGTNFTVLPAPTITSLTPSPVTVGTSPVLSVNGTNFTNTMQVQFASTPLTTTFVSATRLTVTIPAALISTIGNYPVTVLTADGFTTPPVNLPVLPAPTITFIAPTFTTLGAPAPALVVTGTNFTNTMQVAFAGTLLPTTFVSPTRLNATLSPALFSVAGNYNVTVVTSDNYVSPAAIFTVLPAPTITSLAPTFATAGTGPVALVVTGANFTNTMQVQFAGTALATTFVSATQLNATIPTASIAAAGNYNVTVVTSDNYVTPAATFTVLAAPVITSLSPAFATVGTGPVALVVTGANFTNTMRVQFAGTALTTTFVSATRLNATIPAGLLTNIGNDSVTVVTIDGYVSPPAVFIVPGPLMITTTSLPSTTPASSYSTLLLATGGTQPYTWSGTGLQGLTLNPKTGALTTNSTPASTFTISITVTDANGSTANANLTIVVVTPTAPVTITIGSALPTGTVGVGYSASISAGGGTGGFTYSVDVGSLPPGLTLSSGGGISGTPTTPGTFNFTVKATDSSGNVGSAGFSIVIKPAQLTVTGPKTIAPIAVGGSISIQFGATGGIQPYVFNTTGNLPPGTTFSKSALLSGTTTTAGTYSFNVLVSDSTLLQVSQGFTIVVNPPQLSIAGTMPSGQVGVSYSGSIGATGGQQPYTLTVSGLPDGLSFANGSVTGTPTTAKTYTVSASVTDATGTNATGTFTVIIQPAALTITSTFGNGTVGAAYSGSATAAGGVGPPYTITISGLPPGVTASSNPTSTSNSASGIPTTAGPFTISVTATDSAGGTVTSTFKVTIVAPGALVITSASVSNATVGSSVSATFTATGGVPGYTWSSTGLPGGLTLSPGGVLSGSPTAPGPASVTVTVTDSAGTKASQIVTFTVTLPATPPVNLTGLPATSNPATQSTLQIGLATPYPVDVTVTLTLTFAPDSGADDPTVQFSTGGRTATVTIPAGQLTALTTVGVQTGTVAGTATITAQLVAAGVDITPSPAPTRTIRIVGAVATISSVTAAISGTGFTVTVVGFDTTRSITSAIFTFTPASGANLQTTTVTISVTAIFQAWYASSAAAPFGSQFTFTQPFTVQGGVSSIASVTVVLVDSLGNSSPATATLH